MSEAHLKALAARLMAIPATDVYAPSMPMPNILQEANDVLTLSRDPNVWRVLESVGLQSFLRDELELAIGAARAAQSSWTVARDRKKSDAQRDREQRGEALRTELGAACRFNLRDDRVAMGTLSAIQEGEGVADLIQDLSDLATLIERKVSAFERDKTFDAAKHVEDARTLSSEIAAATSAERLVTDQANAVELRDRAYTHLDSIVSTIREAGRYAFRADERLRPRFSSAYLRRHRTKGKSDTSTPVDISAE